MSSEPREKRDHARIKADLPEITVELKYGHQLHSLGRTLSDLRPLLDLQAPAVVTQPRGALTVARVRDRSGYLASSYSAASAAIVEPTPTSTMRTSNTN